MGHDGRMISDPISSSDELDCNKLIQTANLLQQEVEEYHPFVQSFNHWPVCINNIAMLLESVASSGPSANPFRSSTLSFGSVISEFELNHVIGLN